MSPKRVLATERLYVTRDDVKQRREKQRQDHRMKDDEKIKIVVEDGFKIHDVHPTFNKTYTDPVPAKDFAAELIKHTYRKPWSLPDMPA